MTRRTAGAAGSIQLPVGHGLVASPCVSVCRMDERTGWCEGCMRTLAEIADWAAMSDAAKRSVWKLLPQRRAAFDTAAPEGR